VTTRTSASCCHQAGARSARKYSNIPAQPPAVTTVSTLSKLGRRPNAQRRRQFGTKRPPVQMRDRCSCVRAARTSPSTPFLAPVWEPEGRAEQQSTMPLRECRAGRLARDHPLTLNQARRGLGSPTEGIEARRPVPDSLAVQRSGHDLASMQYQRMSAQACPPSGTIRSSGSSTPHSEHWAGCDRRGWSLRCRAIGAPRAYEMSVHRNSATSSGALRANRIIMAIGSELL
jgi:hypothetical protein